MKRNRLPFRRRPLGRVLSAIEAGLFLLAVAPFLLLPADWQIAVFGAVGRRLLPLSPFARRIRANLALIRPEVGDRDARAIAAAVGDNFGRVLAEYIRMPAVRARRERRRASGLEYLRAAIEQGRGAVIVSGHFGNWEAIRLAAQDAGMPVALIYRPFNNPGFDALAMLRIGMAGEPVLHKGPAGMRGMVAHLKAGGVLLILVDQRMTSGVELPFMGEPALTATAVAGMAKRLGAALIPARATRDQSGFGFDVAFEPPVAPADAETMMTEVNARIGAWVDEQPGQWFWLHRRWQPRRRRARASAPD